MNDRKNIIVTDFLPINDAVEKLGISRSAFYKWHRKGKITLKKLEGKTYVDVNELLSKLTDMERCKSNTK